ncbi:hypothetical protein [Streptomyces sp. CAU 1734]|uniref:hypothetical protein n=1 Tax=Streptomyces sp. CAU 1734 TaxID=3140360 RepID=UPI0032605E36
MAGFRLTPNRRNIASFLRAPGTRRVIDTTTRDVEAAAAVAAAEPAAGQMRTDLTDEAHRVRGAVIGDYATADPEKSRRALLRGLDARRT